MSGDPFQFDDALERALASDPVPALSAGFADRVVAATEGRAAPLPKSRTMAAGHWRTGRRVLVGALVAGALATTAAATGVLEELGVELPTPQEVWTSITGQEPQPAPQVQAVESEQAPVIEQAEPVEIVGPIDTPEELEEAFRRVDERRALRRSNRRDAADLRIDARMQSEIERRQEQGLPVPTLEQQQRIRDRIERARERSDQRVQRRLEQRRDQMREDVENGDELSRREFMDRQRGISSDTPVADRLERLRQLPPEERRAVIRQWRQRQNDSLRGNGAIAPDAGLDGWIPPDSLAPAPTPSPANRQLSEYEVLGVPADLANPSRVPGAVGRDFMNPQRAPDVTTRQAPVQPSIPPDRIQPAPQTSDRAPSRQPSQPSTDQLQRSNRPGG